MPRDPAPPPGGERVAAQVLVMSDQELVRHAVSTVLSIRGLEALSVATPVTGRQLNEARRLVARAVPAVGVLLADVTNASDLRTVAAVLRGIRLRWVVSTSAVNPTVSALLLDAGAARLIPAGLTVEALAGELAGEIAAGGDRAPEQAAVAPSRLRARDRALARRLESLSAREMHVLVGLDAGMPVRTIAAQAGVQESTVRDQVRSMLRKLGGTSQLQAVASYRRMNALLGAGGSTGPAQPRPPRNLGK
jgi:DNA-binding NarL/FixJ family response regulator